MRTFSHFALAIFLSTAIAMPQANTDEQEITNFRLNMDNLAKFSNVSKTMMKMLHDDPSLNKRFNESQQNKTIAQTTENIEKNYPAVAAAIHGAGLSPHEYVVMTGTIIGTTMAVGMKKQGMIKTIPPSVSPENAAFVEQNYEKINSLMQSLMQAQNDR